MKLTTILLVQALALAAAAAQEAAFYRIAVTNETRIVSCDPPNALLTWTSSRPNAECAVERAARLGGPWTSNFPHTVVANGDTGGTVVVPLGAGVPPDSFNCGAVLACITNSIWIGTNNYRIETSLIRNMFPPGQEPLWARARLVETNGFAIPASITIPRFRVINGAALWNVYAPSRTPSTPPYVLEVTGSNGPYWAPGTRVDVVLEVAVGNVRYLLKAADRTIGAVW